MEQKSRMKENVFNKTDGKRKLNKNFRETAKRKTREKKPKSRIKLVIMLIHIVWY